MCVYPGIAGSGFTPAKNESGMKIVAMAARTLTTLFDRLLTL